MTEAPADISCLRGFSALEIALVLLVVGLLLAGGLGALRAGANAIEISTAEAFQEQVASQLIEFARANHRLPCPDSNVDGLEDDCSSSTIRTGGVPYYSLGMEPGSTIANTSTGIENLMYGVYRNSTAGSAGNGGADLSILDERTGDAQGDAGYRNREDFRQALRNAGSELVDNGVTASEIYVTGDGQTSGDENCQTNQVANMAFVLISSGATDMDGSGGRFDGLNDAWRKDGSGALCASSPNKRKNAGYDDKVLAYNFDALLGELN
ncbi:hypothetical protein QGM61_01860 [Pseudohongiella sp. SYSU M77423]|uniref:hypothetical protein n=1 Tax=Pseudohongiella sp. SYSU M77423 TaxID=3042312 RepID=UPI00247FF38F|nr:hypothetical protein [Pseudohongiella sp. SYSU M77423]MDH7942553.1 hypothetical protein [Pseudohongiella sp. SYSU M77423]